MALTSYCKKCGRDVPVGERCPHCGGRLAGNTMRVAWCVDHMPVRDWMCWNAVLRVVLPVLAVTLLITVVLEGVLGGWQAAVQMLTGGFITVLLTGLALLLAVLLLVLILQGEDLLDCVVDAKGIHVQQYLQHPTAFRLLMRFKSPVLLKEVSEDDPVLLVGQKEIPWKEIQRVQLWPEKTMILFYAPRWWMRLALPCTPFTYEDAMDFIREKIGKKKKVSLPRELMVTAPPKARAVKPKRTKQLSIDDLPDYPDDPVPETYPAPFEEQPEDFMPLEDVLAEIRAEEQDPL